MFIELLVASTCVSGNPGCAESTSAYYQYNKDLQQVVKNTENYGKKLVNGNEWIVYAATPVYAIASGRDAKFRLFKGTTLGVNVRQSSLFLQWNY